jgi:hypothetical protein
MSYPRWSRLRGALVVMVLLLALAAPAVTQARGHATVFPPGSKPYGLSYNQWGARWLQWALAIPVHVDPNNPDAGFLNPYFVYTDANCAIGQSGPVWFLGNGGTMGATPRTCTVPAGKALMFVGNQHAWCTPAEGDPPGEAALRDCITRCGCDVSPPAVITVDGAQVVNADRYVVSTPLTITLPEDNFIQFFGGQPGTPGSWPAYLISKFYILPPLAPGLHVITSGDANGVGAIWHITVAARGR